MFWRMRSEGNFINYLNHELGLRIAKNPSYSLRAFARDLGINDSTLSKLLTGKRNITAYRITQLGMKLGLTDEKIKKFVSYIKNARQVPSYELAVFHVISKWYHDAILELSKLPGVVLNEQDVSKILGITLKEAKKALEDLVNLKMLVINEKGKIKKRLENSQINFHENSYTDVELRKYQEDIMEKSRLALMKTPKSKRNHTSYIVALDTSLIDEINKRIRNFQEKLAHWIQQSSKKSDAVYALQFCQFPLTTENKND